MSGADFVSKAESAVCGQRGIDDRVKVQRDLNAVVKRHGDQGAAAMLGLLPGVIDNIVARKLVITGDLLTSLYGPRGANVKPDLLPQSTLDAGVAKLLAAAGGRQPPPAKVAATVEAPAPDGMHVAAPAFEAKSVKQTASAEMLEAERLAALGVTRSEMVMRVNELIELHGGAAAVARLIGAEPWKIHQGRTGGRRFSTEVAAALLALAIGPKPEQDAAHGEAEAAPSSADAPADRGAAIAIAPPPAIDHVSDALVFEPYASFAPAPADVVKMCAVDQPASADPIAEALGLLERRLADERAAHGAAEAQASALFARVCRTLTARDALAAVL